MIGSDGDASETRLATLDDRPGPAARISTGRAAEIVSRALAAHERRAALAWTRPLAVAAALVLACGGMAWGGLVLRRWQARSSSATEERGDAPARGHDVGRAVTISQPVELPAQHPELSPVLEPEERLEAATSGELDHPARAERGRFGGAAGRPSPRGGQMAVGAAARTDLLERANTLRAQSRWGDAEQTYRQVAVSAPDSEEAYAATVAAASLRLERLHDVRGALPLYRRALHMRPGGALAEEVRWGIAQTHRMRGDTAAELTALRAFISAHPTSLLRQSAEARLAALGLAGTRSPQ